MNRQGQFGMLGLALRGLGGLFVLGADAFLSQIPQSVRSGFGLYAIAFALGAWSVLTVIFVVNYMSLSHWNEDVFGVTPR